MLTETLTTAMPEVNFNAANESLFRECVNNFMNLAASGAFSDNYGALAYDNIPLKGNDLEKVEWLNKYLKQSLNVFTNYLKLKKTVFVKNSEKAKEVDSFIDDINEELKKQRNQYSEAEYNERLQKIRDNIRTLRDMHKEAAAGGEKNLNKCARILRQIKGLKQQEQEIINIGYYTENTNTNNGDSDVNSSKETNDSIINNVELNNIENEKEIKKTIEVAKKDKKKYLKDLDKEEKEKNELLAEISKNVPDGDTLVPNIPEKIYNPITGEETQAYISETEKRSNSLIDVTFRNYSEAHNDVFPMRTSDNDYFELNPAATPDVVLYKGGNPVAYLNGGRLLPQDSDEAITIKLSYCRIVYSREFLEICYLNEEHALIYSPLEHYGFVGSILAKRAVFIRCSMTENTAINIYVNFLTFITSKSLITEWLELNTNHSFSRQNIIEFIISFTRVFKGLVDEIKKHLFKMSSTMHFDETQYRCLKISGKCYIWVAVTGKHETDQGIIFLAAEGRGHKDFLQFFDIEETENNNYEKKSKEEVNLTNIVTDGHTAYPRGISILVKFAQKVTYHGLCYVHVRRDFLIALDAFGIRIEYQIAVRKSGNENFMETLLKVLAQAGKTNLSEVVYKIANITFIVDTIIALDVDFTCKTGAEILERRTKYAISLVDQLFDQLKKIYNENKNLISTHQNKDGSLSYLTNGIQFAYIKAIVYALNHEESLRAFIKDGDIETHNNIAETAIRRIVRQRYNMLFLYSKYGFTAYADAMTLFSTLRCLKIHPHHYLQWVFDNVKKELFERWCTTADKNSAKGLCYMPKDYIVNKDEEGERKVRIYDKDYESPYDSVNWKYYTPYEYKKRLNYELKIYKKLEKIIDEK